MLLTPLSPVTNYHTYSDPLPLERDVGLLYGRPLNMLRVAGVAANIMKGGRIGVNPEMVRGRDPQILGWGHVVSMKY